MKDREDFQRFIVPVGREALLFAPLHGFSALMNGSAERALKEDFAGNAAAVLGDWANEIGVRLDPPVAPTGSFNPSFLGIITTRSCNIGCHYCSFGSRAVGRERMRLDVARWSVDWYVGRVLAANRQDVCVHFFGGEPLIARDVVELVVHRARALAAQHGLKTHFDVSTNGIMGNSIREFVAEYFDSIVLSFDGSAKFHDRNRPGKRGQPTFNLVGETAAYLRDKPVEVCIRLCVTRESAAELDELTQWMCSTFQPSVINYETLTPGDLAERAGLYPPDPYEFARSSARAFRTARKLGVTPTYGAADVTKARRTFCGVGADAAIVSMDGRVSGCYLMAEDWQQRGMDLDMGMLQDAQGAGIDPLAVARVRAVPSGKKRCQGCFCRYTCAGGCHVNQTYPDASIEYTDFCQQTRLLTACALLDEMGLEDRVDALLADQAACVALATHRNDGLMP